MDGQRGLFPAAPYMSNRARYPRGYTPERQREVRAALRAGGLNNDFGTLITTRMSNGEVWADPKQGRGPQFEQDLVRQTLARSTVPVHDLRHLDVVATNNPLDGAGGHYDHQTEGEPRMGIPSEPAAAINVGGSIKQRRPGEMLQALAATDARVLDRSNDVGQFLIHELGHHVQNIPHLDRGTHMQYQFNALARDRVAQTDPALEADANNYEETHFRNDHRFPPAKPVTESVYDTTFVKHSRGAHPAELANWAMEYGKVRNLSPRQFVPPPKPEPEQGRLW